jgi:signal transduction histidine kinase
MVERKPFIVEDAQTDPRVNRQLISFLNVKSFAAVPLFAKEKVRGGIAADNLFSQSLITEKKLQSLMIFANQAGLALENALMYEELKAFSSQMEERVRRATAELEETQKQLFQSEKLAALGKLSAGIAHEIRNPLTSIKILIHSLVDEMATEASREKDLRVIESEIQRVNKIIKQFLDFARPREPALEPTDILEVLQQTANLLSYEMEAQEISLQRSFPPELPRVLADKEQMMQVFLNLMLNAIQAMPQGGELCIAARLPGDGPQPAKEKRLMGKGGRGNFVEISIADTGVGIPEEIKGKLFEPFFSTKEEGIGLGLSIAQRIVEQHGGRIRAESISRKGATFFVELPVSTGSERGVKGGPQEVMWTKS